MLVVVTNIHLQGVGMNIIGTQPPMLLRAKLRRFSLNAQRDFPNIDGVLECPPHERVKRVFTAGDHEVSKMLTVPLPEAQFVRIGDGKSSVTIDVANGGVVTDAINPPRFGIKNFWDKMLAIVDEFAPTRPTQARG